MLAPTLLHCEGGASSSKIGTYIWMFDTDRIRDLDNTLTMNDYVSGAIYPNSRIFSGVLWDYRTDPNVTASDADEDVLESLNNLDSNPTFDDAFEGLLVAAISNGHSANANDIIDAFEAHGIDYPLNAYIYGPPRVYEPDYFTYEARVHDGVPPYTYNWDHGGGTGSEATFWIDDHITIGVVVKDALYNTIYHYVYPTKEVEYRGYKIASDSHLPTSYGLKQNYPNPFNPTTEIKYQLPEAAHVKLTIYNILGQEVVQLVNTQQAIGFYSVKFDASQFASGTYIYRLEAGDFIQTKRMVLIK